MVHTSSPVTVHGLVCHAHVQMAFASFSSLLKFSVQPLQVMIHDDGSLTATDVEQLNRLPNTIVLTRAEADERMNPLLKNYPNCYNIRYEHPMFLKLLDTALLSDGDIAYCDTDVFFFHPFEQLFHWPDAETAAIFMMDYLEAYSVFPWHLVGSNRLKLPSKVNAGLMFVRKNAYDLDFVEWFLGQKSYRSNPVHKMEQTCWAALGHRIGCRLWQPEQVVLMRPHSVLNPQMIAGHFVKEVRYRLPEFMPCVDRNLPEAPPLMAMTVPSQHCNVIDLGKNHLKRQSNRIRSHLRRRLMPVHPQSIG